MKKALFSRMLRWNLRASLRWEYLGTTAVLFAFIGWRSALQVTTIPITSQSPATANVNVWDAFLFAFAGPGVWDSSILSMLAWFVPHLLFFYLAGDWANRELLQRGYCVLPLIGSRLRWWWGQVVTLFLAAVGYTLLSCLAVLTGAMSQLPWSWQGSALLNSETLWSLPQPVAVGRLLAWVLALFGGTVFALTFLQTALAIWWRRSFYGFIAITVIALLSWLLGTGNPQLVRWLPGSQSMLIRHTPFEPGATGFSIGWSLAYNAALILAVGASSARYVRRMDIPGEAALMR